MQSSLLASEQTIAAVLRSLASISSPVLDWLSFSRSLLRVNWMGLAAGLVRR